MDDDKRDPLWLMDTEVLKQRVAAARALRGYSQKDLDELFEKDGVDKKAAGRVERGELAMQRVHRDAFCRHLRVPERWFSSDDVDELVGYVDFPERLSRDDLRAAAALLAPELLGAVQALMREQARDEPGKDEPDR